MRRIVMFNHLSADGYFAAPDGGLDWVVQDDQVFEASKERMPKVGTMLFGRRTYELFEAFWPKALDDSATAPDPHNPDRRSRSLKEMAVAINEGEKVVFSRTRKEVTWKNSRLVRELDPKQVAAMKSEAGTDMIVFGSASVVSQLTEHGLIDEYQFALSPVLLGNGRTLLRELSRQVKLELAEARGFHSGAALLRYTPARQGQA